MNEGEITGLLLILLVIGFIIFICACMLNAYDGKRTEPLSEINAVESVPNTNVAVNYDSIPTGFEPSAPLEEIYTIEITPDTDAIDSKPPAYNEIMETNDDSKESPPSYLESFQVSKFNTLV